MSYCPFRMIAWVLMGAGFFALDAGAAEGAASV